MSRSSSSPSASSSGRATGSARRSPRAFAAEGLAVCVTRRPRHTDALEALADEHSRARRRERHAFAARRARGGRDRRRPSSRRIERDDRADCEVVVFNIGANVRFPVAETTERVYRKVWEMAALAGFLTEREAARVMTPRGPRDDPRSPARPRACAAAPAIPPSPAPSTRCARWRRARRASSGRRASMSRMW